MDWWRPSAGRAASSLHSLKLRGLDAQAVYEIKNADLEGPTRASGRDLMDQGLPVTAARRPRPP